jgi:predicted regulator of Ras-like GTPase activity (Roadblock/LC7/MglB family)
MPSAFGEILSELVGETPGALGAVFIDVEGEAIDQFSHIPVFDILIAGAHWGIILRLVREFLARHRLGEADLLILHAELGDVIIKCIAEEYAVILALKPDAHLQSALRAMEHIAGAIRAEM